MGLDISSFTGTSQPLDSLHGRMVAANGFMYLVGVDPNSSYISKVQYAPINADGTLGAWQYTSALPNVDSSVNGQPQGIFTDGSRVFVVGIADWNGTSTITYDASAPINADGTLGAWTRYLSNWDTLGIVNGGAPYYNQNGGGTKYQFLFTGGHVYLVGGNISGNNVSYTTEAFVYFAQVNTDGSFGAWRAATSLPFASDGMYVTTDGTYVYGFDSGGGGIIRAQINSADGTLGAWSNIGSIPSGFYDQDFAGVTIGNTVYLYYSNSPNAIWYADIDPATGTIGTWTQATNAPVSSYASSPEVTATSNCIYFWDASVSIYAPLTVTPKTAPTRSQTGAVLMKKDSMMYRANAGLNPAILVGDKSKSSTQSLLINPDGTIDATIGNPDGLYLYGGAACSADSSGSKSLLVCPRNPDTGDAYQNGYIFDWSTKLFTATVGPPDKPSASDPDPVALFFNGKPYVIFNGLAYGSEMYWYDQVNNAWMSDALPPDICDGPGISISNGNYMVLSKADGTAIFEYDVYGLVWNTLANPPSFTGNGVFVDMGGSVMWVGGTTRLTVASYNVSTHVWTVLSQCPDTSFIGANWAAEIVSNVLFISAKKSGGGSGHILFDIKKAQWTDQNISTLTTHGGWVNGTELFGVNADGTVSSAWSHDHFSIASIKSFFTTPGAGGGGGGGGNSSSFFASLFGTLSAFRERAFAPGFIGVTRRRRTSREF